MTLETLGLLKIRLEGQNRTLPPGAVFTLIDDQGKKLLAKLPGKVRRIVQPGDVIRWHRADGSALTGIVDFVYKDVDGTRWAFVTTGATWAAINCKYAGVTE